MENVQNYLNPLTVEAEIFVNSFEKLAKTNNSIDVNLICSLEKVMLAIEKFMDTVSNEIVATEETHLVKCDSTQVNRYYRCERCGRDLGKSMSKVTLHLTTQCTPQPAICESADKISVKKITKKNRKQPQQKKEKQIEKEDNKLSKKTRTLLTANLNTFFVDMVKIGEKLKCIPDYDAIEEDLLDLITPLFPNQNIKIYKFGSRLAGIGTRESDLDLYIDIGHTFNNFQNRADFDTLMNLNAVYDALKDERKSWKALVKIEKARVPIVKMIHASTGIECDINFSNSLGSINTKFLEYIFTLQPMARLLCIFFKKWLNRTRLNDEISTYTIILMVLFYLQNIKILPSVKILQDNLNPDAALRVGPWIASYSTFTLKELNIPLVKITEDNILKFIIGFFQYYINFDFKTYAVCPYLGKLIKREDLENEMTESYRSYVILNDESTLQLEKPVVVQDPIQLNHNVTKAISVFTLQNFITFMAQSVKVMQFGHNTSK